MRKQTYVEVWCEECGATHTLTHSVCRCKSCLSPRIHVSRYITCDCGTQVYLDGNTNQCERCGQYYNGFGEEIRPPEEWDEETRYAFFGPLNDPYEDY